MCQVLQFYFYIDKKPALPKGILLILSLTEKKKSFQEHYFSCGKNPTKPFLKHFHFQKDANIVSSPFPPLCVSGEFQVIEEQHSELKIDEQEGDRPVPYTYFSFSLNKCYMLLLRSPINILKSFLMNILILIQWMRNSFSSLGTAWGSERFHSSSSDTDTLEGTTTRMRFKFLKTGVQELQTPTPGQSHGVGRKSIGVLFHSGLVRSHLVYHRIFDIVYLRCCI